MCKKGSTCCSSGLDVNSLRLTHRTEPTQHIRTATRFNLSTFQDRNQFSPQDGSMWSQVRRAEALSEPGFVYCGNTENPQLMWRSAWFLSKKIKYTIRNFNYRQNNQAVCLKITPRRNEITEETYLSVHVAFILTSIVLLTVTCREL